MDSYFRIFIKKPAVLGVGNDSDLSVRAIGSQIVPVRNDDREQTIAFIKPSSGHYLVAFIVHAFKDFSCDWIGLISDCYIFHAFSLDSQFINFNPDFSLKTIQESDGEIQDNPN